MKHEELLAAHLGPDGNGTDEVTVYFKADPPGAYDRAEIYGQVWVPVTEPAFPRDWPDWRRVA